MSRLAVLPFALLVSHVGSVHDEVHPEEALPAVGRFPGMGQAPYRSRPDWAMDS
jgi:hypothetical protein